MLRIMLQNDIKHDNRLDNFREMPQKPLSEIGRRTVGYIISGEIDSAEWCKHTSKRFNPRPLFSLVAVSIFVGKLFWSKSGPPLT